MKDKKIFSNKLVYAISIMLTAFSIFIYLLFFYNLTGNVSIKGFIAVSFMLVLAGLQFYFLLTKNRKCIIFTNIHLLLILIFAIYQLIEELIFYQAYTRDANGIVFLINLVLVSLFIVNKYKVPKMQFNDLEEIGKAE